MTTPPPLIPDLPRRQRIKRAHVVEASLRDPRLARFECRCGWKSGWLRTETVSEAIRGIPCPVCNGDDRVSP